MRLLCLGEHETGEKRVALVPSSVKNLIALGCTIWVESGAGKRSGYSDADYQQAGAAICQDRLAALADTDLLVKIHPLTAAEIRTLRQDSISLSMLDPYRQPELVQQFAASGVQAISLEMIPRSTLAQKMDVLSSQANLAGYAAVVLAAEKSDRIFPLMMTPAGTLQAAKVLIIGVGVAGLQAIATAKRLGARVTAFDTRPVVEEQVKSLGAKFLKIEMGELGQTEQGYAKELNAEQLALQQQGIAKACGDADVVITTAQVFGRNAPRILTEAMLGAMKPGSLVLDLAVASGGNVAGSVADQETDILGVRVLGCANLAAKVSRHASQMFSSNIQAFITHFWDQSKNRLLVDSQAEIMRDCLLTKNGQIVHAKFK